MTTLLYLDATYLNFALGLHKLQFGLCKLQLHLSQLLLQCILLIICFDAFVVRAYSRHLQCPLLAENLTAVFAGHHFTLKYPESSFLIPVTGAAVLPGRAILFVRLPQSQTIEYCSFYNWHGKNMSSSLTISRVC